MLNRHSLLTLSMTLALCIGSVPASGDVDVPLVLVNEDTITTNDLRLEIDVMKRMNPDAEGGEFPEPGQVLRRLIQNQLVLQEGYRMGLDETVSVTNQVTELTRTKGMVTLLDSVALSVPEGTADLTEARKKAVKSYIAGLMETHNVSVDSTLLRSLDYGSDDEQVQEYLRTSEDIVAVLPTGNMSVARFTRVLRFTEFHGLIGKPDADQRRDKVFGEWITEAVLTYQARIQKLDRQPRILDAARNLEHFLVRQEAIKELLKSPYQPTAEEIEQYYNDNLDSYMSPVRIKMKSKKLNTKEAAEAFREKLVKGADIEWLAGRDAEVITGKDPFPYEWFPPKKLGLEPENAVLGHIPDPYGVPGGWVVAVVSEVEEPNPRPLAECRSKIVAKLKARHQQELMADIMRRLEEASRVEVLPGAEQVVQGVLEEAH